MARTIRFAMALGLWGVLVVRTERLTAAAAPRPDPFAACRQQFAAKPLDYESAYCFYQTALNGRVLDEGARVFEALMREHPDNFWLPLAYGHTYRERDPIRAEALYRQSADGFQKQRNADGEILARSNLRNYLFPRGRLQDATVETERVVALGVSVDDPMLKAQAWMLQASHVQDTGGDLGVAYRLLKQSERAIFPHGSYRLKRTCLNSLGSVAFRMGRVDEALAIYEELDRLAAAAGDALEQAATRYNILNASSMKEDLLPTPGAKQRLTRLAEEAAGVRAVGAARARHVEDAPHDRRASRQRRPHANGGARTRQVLPHARGLDPPAPRRSGLLLVRSVAPSRERSRPVPCGGGPGARGDRPRKQPQYAGL